MYASATVVVRKKGEAGNYTILRKCGVSDTIRSEVYMVIY